MTKTDLSSSDNLIKNASLSKSIAWYGLGNVFIRALSFLLLPVYSNLITTTEFGNYSLLMSVYSITAIIYQFGTQSILKKHYLEENNVEKRKVIFSSIFNSLVISGLFLTVILTITSVPLSKFIFGKPDFYTLLFLVYSSLFFDSISMYVISLLKTKEMAKKSVYYLLIGAIGNFLLNIVFVYMLRLSVAGIFLAQLVSSALLLFMQVGIIKKEYVFKIDPIVFKSVLFFALPLVAANLFTSMVNFGDRFILNYFVGREEVGLYSFAYRIALIMNVLVAAFENAWSPRSINQFYKNDYKYYYGKVLTKFIALSCILLLSVSLFAQYLFKIHLFNISLFNPVYSAGIIVIPFVVTGYIFNGISAFYSVYPYVSNKSFHFLIADSIALVSNIAINIILIPRIGIIGAGYATTLAFLFEAGYMFLISRRKIEIIYQSKELLIAISAVLLFLITGMYIKNIAVHFLLVILYILILRFVAKIKFT
ncbi:MAG: oligosaccharide flippase family protein [Ignavibacteriaceae bacterium]|nr:oligosaccharide flippase family protein [Ignavibacteriaceae bacterium]